MRFGASRASGLSPFLLEGQRLPWVQEYKYLGVVIDPSLCLRGHVKHLRERAHARFWQVCGWARREGLPLAIARKLVDAYVIPGCLFGAELLCPNSRRMGELLRLQREIGRYLLASAHAPNVVVQGDLAWSSWDFLAIERAANLVSRLTSASDMRLAVRVFHYARTIPSSWCGAICTQLQSLGVSLPWCSSVNVGCPIAVRRAYLRCSVRPVLAAADTVRWRQNLNNMRDSALQRYGRCMGHPVVSAAHSWRVNPAHALAWGRVRSGSSVLGADRISRHACGSSQCALCGHHLGDLAHFLMHCPNVATARNSWWGMVGFAFGGQPLEHIDTEAVLAFFCFSSHREVAWAAANARFAHAIECAHSQRM